MSNYVFFIGLPQKKKNVKVVGPTHHSTPQLANLTPFVEIERDV